MKRHLSAFLTVILALAGSGARAISPEARGSALGGAFTSMARGAEGLWWNPGVMGSPLLASAFGGYTVEGGNNALKLTQFRGILFDDAGARADAAADIRKAGSWDARIEMAGGGGATVKGFSVGFFPHILVSAQDVTPDMADAILKGNGGLTVTPGQFYDLGGELTEATYSEYVAGYGRELVGLIPGVKFNAGATVKYFIGTDYRHDKLKLQFTAGPGPSPAGEDTHEAATKGTGFGFDLGIQATMFTIVKAGVVAKNLGTTLTWKDATSEARTFNPSNGTYTSVTTIKDVKQAFPQFYALGASVTLPVIGTSAAVGLDMRTKPSETRLHAGVEQSIAGILAFRGGVATAAGPAPMMYTAGLGVGALVAHVDVAAGFSPGGKGGTFSASANVNF